MSVRRAMALAVGIPVGELPPETDTSPVRARLTLGKDLDIVAMSCTRDQIEVTAFGDSLPKYVQGPTVWDIKVRASHRDMQDLASQTFGREHLFVDTVVGGSRIMLELRVDRARMDVELGGEGFLSLRCSEVSAKTETVSRANDIPECVGRRAMAIGHG